MESSSETVPTRGVEEQEIPTSSNRVQPDDGYDDLQSMDGPFSTETSPQKRDDDSEDPEDKPPPSLYGPFLPVPEKLIAVRSPTKDIVCSICDGRFASFDQRTQHKRRLFNGDEVDVDCYPFGVGVARMRHERFDTNVVSKVDPETLRAIDHSLGDGKETPTGNVPFFTERKRSPDDGDEGSSAKRKK